MNLQTARERRAKALDQLKAINALAEKENRELTPEEQMSTGVSPDLVRLSVGTEDKEDIIADLKKALDSI